MTFKVIGKTCQMLRNYEQKKNCFYDCNQLIVSTLYQLSFT